MSELWSYGLSDFLLFSPRVYYRLFELHNRALWPAQILTPALGVAILYLLVRRPLNRGHRAIPAILGALWIWIAWAFLWQRYATINWASAYMAPIFVMQGLSLIWIGTVRRALVFAQGREIRDFMGLAILTLSIFVYPVIAPLMGRPWWETEVFGIVPDPTALATLAVLSLSRSRTRWLLFPIPLLWCAISGATLWVMGAGDFLIAPVGALATFAIAVVGNSRDPR
jgi:Family of unknown function (DUF6064)